jgi:Flp pilus assembly pilin Flp
MVWSGFCGPGGLIAGWRGDRRGVTAVEYAIIAGIMVVALVVSVPFIAPSITSIFNNVSTKL